MLSGRQIRAARALLGWNQQQLADEAGLSLDTVSMMEREAVGSTRTTLEKVETVLKAAGVVFQEPDGQMGEGVRLVRR